MSTEPTIDDLLRQKMNELQTEHDALLAQSKPLRAEKDQISNGHVADPDGKRYRELRDQIRNIEAPIPGLAREIGRIARSLGGRALSTAPVSGEPLPGT